MTLFGAAKAPDWKTQLRALGRSMHGLPPGFSGAEGLENTAKNAAERLERDLKDLDTQGRFIFAAAKDSEDFTEENAELLRRWHAEGQAPSLAALCLFSIGRLGLNLPPDMTQGVLTAALLGEVENNLPYHNNLHYKKVLLQLLRLVSVHNGIYEGTSRAFDDRQVALLMIAACIHDLGHDGIGNTIKGVHHPGHVERHSFASAAPYLKAAGLGETSLAELKVLLITTDVSPLGDPGNYMNQMKAAYRFHFLGERKGLQSLNLDADLALMQKTPALAMMGLILHEADISTSAGLNYDITKYETAIYGREIGEENARPSHVIEFLDTVCQHRMLSHAAQKLYAGNLARIYALAEEDVKNGNQPLPKPEHSDFIAGRAGKETSKTIN